jgi:probable addiction module antidote protein
MSGRSKSYKEGLHRRLRNNAEAVNYLQAALEDSQSAFLVALKNVLDARKVAAVARASKVNREHIYQMLSDEGNPTLNSLQKILQALGLRLTIELGRIGTKTPILPKEPTVRQKSRAQTAA